MSTFNMLLLGGSPIYLAGLTDSLIRSFPNSQISLRSSELSQLVSTVIFVSSDTQKSTDQYLKQQLQKYAPARFFVIGPLRTPHYVRSLINAGITGYLLHYVSPETLVEVVAGTQAGELYLDPKLEAEWIRQQLRIGRKRTVSISKREREVLQLITEEFTTAEIASKLFICLSTVESHRASILSKLGVRNVAGIVREAILQELCTLQ
jgi:DNA-binding NarL/FixJ family response regulator